MIASQRMRGSSPVHKSLAFALSLSMAWLSPPLGVSGARSPDPVEDPATAETDVPEAPAPEAPEASEGLEDPTAKAAILPLTVTGELSEADQQALTDELVEGLQRGNFGVIVPTDVAAVSPDAAECADAKCYTRIASATSATHVVWAQIEVEDRDYNVVVQLIDGATGSVMASSQEGCEICGIADAGNLVASAAATLRTKLDALAKGPSTLTVVSDPVDAVVTIDGDLVGTTPLDRPVIPGKHVIRVTKEGFIAIEREVTLVEGVQESISFELEKVPSRLPKRPWGWASLGVGIVGLGGGLALTFIHDQDFKAGGGCSGQEKDTDGNCKFLWDTKWYGISAAVAGAALTTLGVAILLNTAGNRPKRDKGPKKKKASARVGVGPGQVMLQGRF